MRLIREQPFLYEKGIVMAGGSHSKLAYCKPWLSIADQISKLESRGLVITDRLAAESFLRHFNYYRFSGYCLAFESSKHNFHAGVTFENVKYSSEFDSELRDMVSEALELIEINLRTGVAYYYGQKYGGFGHTSTGNFHPKFDNQVTHSRWTEELRREAKRSKEMFVWHFQNKYSQFPDLPVWVVTEIMTFGSLARMVRGMSKADRRSIAAEYGFSPKVFFSLVLHLNYLRNLCAHHARIWDRKMSVKSDQPLESEWQNVNAVSNQRIFSSLLLIRRLMQQNPQLQAEADRLRDRFNKIMLSPPPVQNPFSAMGLPVNWAQHPVWV